MNFNWFKKEDEKQKVIQVLKERDLNRRDEEIEAMKRLNKTASIITKKGDIEIIVRNVKGVMMEIK